MSRQKNLKRNLLICLLAGSAVMYTLPLHAATSVVANNALPTLPMVNGQIKDGYGFVTGGNNTNIVTDGLQMNITQNDSNAAIKWGSFDVGGSATVNFDYTGKSDFNTLNYVNSASASQIYGTINAQHEGYNGNIFVVNPAGVQIGPSAQINVGSLYVSNKYLNENELAKFNGNNITSLIDTTKTANAELMSLGNINAANNVTFDGNRIVLDTDRVIIADSQNGKLNIKTTDTNNVVLGYEAYDENNGYTDTVNKEKSFDVTKVTIKNGTIEEQDTNVKGYMWVEDVEQLQAINTNLGGNYALRNSIDATSTSGWSDSEHDTKNEGFLSIGIDYTGKVTETNINNEIKYGFYGNFDGIDYNIFGLTINREDTNNVGLFGVAHDANINNVTLVGGSITGGSVVGSVVGAALGNTHITNATNSASVTGNTDVGGIVGYSGNKISDGDNGNINVSDTDSHFTNLINTGTVYSKGESDGSDGTISNTGGLIGYMYNGTLDGNSYNLGDVSGDGYNVGGLVGHAVNSTIGDGKNLVYNRLDVTGKYNVGGIVGNMEGTTVQNAENSGNVTATGHKDDVYKYHAGTKDNTDLKTVNVYVANVGGIAGSSSQDSAISDVENTGDVKTVTEQANIYAAGNVGGIVGSAVDTNITNATNKENEVRGAHNVGGVAGYFGNSSDDKIRPDYTLTTGINDGGDIMATGARYNGGFVTELVRANGSGNENFTIGNIGGVVGYLDGDNVYVTGGANRGTVHTYDEFTGTTVPNYAKAANVGGVVGKLDRSDTLTIAEMKENGQIDVTNAAVSNSYNTGDVLGYTGVGGVVGMMFNGEVAGSYNLGYIRTTRQSDTSSEEDTDIIDSLNMGGIVGDTTEETQAEVLLYDVYNKGQIGDNDFNYFGRHVGGVVGRLSGEVQKAYNTGAIYNGYNVVGGIAGWMYKGKIENAFNTGNITVYNKNKASSQVGGVVGAAANASNITINNVYNLGTIRSFRANSADSATNSLGGILGEYNTNYSSNTKITISNAYTTGNLYVNSGNIGSIYGVVDNRYITLKNTYYIRPQDGLGFDDLYSRLSWNNRDNANYAVLFTQKSTYNYQFDNGITRPDTGATGEINENADWRIYDGNTPILNAFLPNAEKYFDQYQNKEDLNNAGINSIQYGTAYDPLLTIIKANGTKDNLSYNWSDLGISSAAGIAVYGAGLTLDDINTSSGTGYFGGTIYADGALNLNAKVTDTNNISGNIGLGSASQIYGSSVNIDADGKVTIYGDVTATGNRDNGTTDTIDTSLAVEDAGNITIAGSDVDVYGTLTSATKDTTGATVKIPGIEENAVTWEPGAINNPSAAMDDIADRFAHTTGPSAVNGDITITANGVKDENDEIIGGNVNLYYGNKQEGLITSGGDLTVTGEGDVYVDSDLDIGGNLTLEAGAGKEALLDITNIGQVQAKNGTVANTITGLNNFLNHFVDSGNNKISFGNTQDAKITVDMWNGNTLELNKFGSDFTDKLDKLNLNGKHANKITHIWVNNGEQLKNIQNADNKALDYNFALKGDINASDVENYVAIGTGSEFTGTFDGRGNRIIGLDTTKDASGGNNNYMANAGIFSTIGEGGTVKNVNIYSGNFNGTDTAGAVAGVNKGRIENVTGFGNTVTVTGDVSNAGNAGGIVGVNNGKSDFETSDDGASTLTGNGIYDVQSIGSVITASGVAGGLVGTNEGALGNSYSDSAVTSTAGTSAGLGGVVGVNKGDVQYVDSLGVTNGGTNSDKVGGIIGVNNGNMYSGYNESIVSGKDNVGGIIGVNTSTVSNIVNATGVVGTNNIGGLVGYNSNSVTNGRNNGTITGDTNVGGLVGYNGENAVLTDLVNAESADITGVTYVGGIAGNNAGTITTGKADDESEKANLINRGSITGHTYVGGVAGTNSGTITNANNDVELNADATGAQYFGGIAGENTGTIENATNTANVNAAGAEYVGGIVGLNNGTLNGSSNEGSVTGLNFVGGVAGKNEAAINGTLTDGELTTIKNSGTVTAENGGAGGIIGVNSGAINNVHLISEGTVTGTDSNQESGTGGIFGINEGAITNSVLENTKGTVSGVSNTGGLIGINSGNISQTSLKNVADINVDNKDKVLNIGGLIGKNTGTITGGRVEADGKTDAGYYKYQIYNNGTITVTGEGENIGGLIGYNTKASDTPGSLTAGYNTGAIKAENSSNVGGIVGKNEGIVDQVFNTVMTGVDDKGNTLYGTITGKDNVGGLVGANSGTLSNAYNTTEVKGDSNVGTIIGYNTSVNASDVYNTWNVESSKLIGIGNAAKDAYNIDSNNKNDYSELDFTDTWKIYEGNSNPLLKVFLTNLTVNETVKIDDKEVTLKDYLNLVYNGKEQDLDIADLIDKGFITAPNKELLNAYKNTLKDQSNGLGESYLLDNADGQKNAGNYQNDEWLYSNQIHSSTTGSFNPNNLGYDINFVDNDGSITVDRATINIDLNDIYHTYGDVDNVYIDKDRHNKTSYEDSYTISNWTELDEVLQDYIEKYLIVQFKEGSDGAVNGDKTQSVGDYNWSLDFTLGGTDASNYQIGEGSGNVNSVTITGTDKSHVEKAKLTININDVDMTYGDKETAISGQYGYAASTNVGEKLVNGDSLKDVIADMGYNNTAYNADGTTKDVIDGKYALQDKDVTGGSKYGNYEITINDGEVTMGKAQLVVDINDVTMTYGDKESTISNQYGYTVNNGLVNKDSLKDVIADMAYENTAYNTDGTTKDVIDGKYALQDKDVTGGSKYGNYEITINDGEVTMGKAQLVVDINDVTMTYGDKESTISNQYGYTVNNGLVNEDNLKDVIADMTYENTAYNADGTTKDVIGGKYALENKDITVGGKYGNYEVTINDGTVMMNKADLNIKVDNANTTVGKMPGELTGTVEGLTNGDTLPTHDFALKDDSLISVSGNHENVIGIVIGGKFYELGDADWSNGLFANYDVNYEMGDLAVSVVEIPDNWPNNRWDYLFGDNPFDRNENFRERKAEVNFVDGAMEI